MTLKFHNKYHSLSRTDPLAVSPSCIQLTPGLLEMPSWWLPSQKAWLAEARGLTLLLPTDETLVVYSKEVGKLQSD